MISADAILYYLPRKNNKAKKILDISKQKNSGKLFMISLDIPPLKNGDQPPINQHSTATKIFVVYKDINS